MACRVGVDFFLGVNSMCVNIPGDWREPSGLAHRAVFVSGVGADDVRGRQVVGDGEIVTDTGSDTCDKIQSTSDKTGRVDFQRVLEVNC